MNEFSGKGLITGWPCRVGASHTQALSNPITCVLPSEIPAHVLKDRLGGDMVENPVCLFLLMVVETIALYHMRRYSVVTRLFYKKVLSKCIP